MREILFKAKRKSDGKWVEGYLVPISYDTRPIGYEIINKDGINYDELDYYQPNFVSEMVEPETISQYTGLCDKNGRKIFENDIVDMNRKGCGFKRIEKVFYEEGAFSPISVHGWECVPDADEIEVIGNIFDNPELLEDK